MTNSDRGREGVKNHENLADVICTCPLWLLVSNLPRERQVSTTAQSEVTVALSSWMDLSMTLSSMMCFTSFLSSAISFSL